MTNAFKQGKYALGQLFGRNRLSLHILENELEALRQQLEDERLERAKEHHEHHLPFRFLTPGAKEIVVTEGAATAIARLQNYRTRFLSHDSPEFVQVELGFCTLSTNNLQDDISHMLAALSYWYGNFRWNYDTVQLFLTEWTRSASLTVIIDLDYGEIYNIPIGTSTEYTGTQLARNMESVLEDLHLTVEEG